MIYQELQVMNTNKKRQREFYEKIARIMRNPTEYEGILLIISHARGD